MENITINSVSLELKDWNVVEQSDSKIMWMNSRGDILSVNFFAKKPDLPKDVPDIKAIRDMYRAMVTKANGAIGEVEKESLDSLLAIRTVFKFPQKPSGFSFLGSYTVPMEEFSFVFKITCRERGMDGTVNFSVHFYEKKAGRSSLRRRRWNPGSIRRTSRSEKTVKSFMELRNWK
jgi:hypothetical protein